MTRYEQAKEMLRLKFGLMQDQIDFLEYVWSCMNEEERDFYRNNYRGKLPKKYEA